MIKIIDETYLDADVNCYITFDWNGNKDKHNRMLKQNMRYYSDLGAACTALINRLIRKGIEDERITNLQELIEEIKKYRIAVKDAVRAYSEFESQ